MIQDIKRICLVGAESTGKTTLAQQLAEHYHTLWVPEYGRDYTKDKVAEVGDMAAIEWTTQDFITICEQQIVMEDSAALEANRLLICDTDPLATSIWHERYMNFHSEEVWAFARDRQYDLYLLTETDIPFTQDGQRDGEHVREWMNKRFRQVLNERGLPWTTVRGLGELRLKNAIAAIDANFAEVLQKEACG